MIDATLHVHRMRGYYDQTPERRWHVGAADREYVERPYSFDGMPSRDHLIADALPGHMPALIVRCVWTAGRLTVVCWAEELPTERPVEVVPSPIAPRKGARR